MIYCVEDDSTIREIEIYTLRSTGFEAEGFADADSFSEALKKAKPELVILDVMLPGEDGVEVLKKLRGKKETREIPVIMATAKGTEHNKVESLDMGADDYLVKPFGMMEMVSRIRAVLRRTGSVKRKTITLGNISLDVEKHKVTVGENAVELTPKEFELLRVLMENPGSVFNRDKLLSIVWDMDISGETRTVDVHVTTLRQKIAGATAVIKTVRGVGYQIEER